MRMKNLRTLKSLSAAIGAGGLIALAVTTMHAGLGITGPGAIEAKGGGSTHIVPTAPPNMQMGQTAGEEPAPILTSTTPVHPASS